MRESRRGPVEKEKKERGRKREIKMHRTDEGEKPEGGKKGGE